eukprot:TRINITY_DN3605_c0_g1_i1.p1 TRINITY_DN3605_c0_g1~~TRINITY_DN3605_c0_g1_i1.p1  ORF type:complete len:235 (-),score=49.22 TRINITY_DN3605_c0_g1_i1:222-926(-)
MSYYYQPCLPSSITSSTTGESPPPLRHHMLASMHAANSTPSPPPTMVGSPLRKRLHWTEELHEKFEKAVQKLGSKARPSKILKEMNVENITREQVASHLQKYRSFLAETNAAAAAASSAITATTATASSSPKSEGDDITKPPQKKKRTTPPTPKNAISSFTIPTTTRAGGITSTAGQQVHRPSQLPLPPIPPLNHIPPKAAPQTIPCPFSANPDVFIQSMEDLVDIVMKTQKKI